MSTLTLGLTGKQAAALASVGQAAASTDPTLPALRTVKITATSFDDEAVIEAVATDRFVAARIRFNLPTDVTDGHGTFLIDATRLTEIARAAKKHKGKDVAVVLDVREDRYSVKYWDGTEQTSTLPDFDYPPVEKLIPYTTKDLYDIPAGSAMNPALLAKAAKLKHPDDMPSDPPVFEFYQTQEKEPGAAVPWLLTRRDGDVQLVAMGAHNNRSL